MTTGLRRGRLKIAICREANKQHHAPDCHVYLLDAEAVFDLNDLRCLANNGFRKKALTQIEEIVSEHKEEFLEIWRLLNEEE